MEGSSEPAEAAAANEDAMPGAGLGAAVTYLLCGPPAMRDTRPDITDTRRGRAALSVIGAFALVPLWRSAETDVEMGSRLVALIAAIFVVQEAIARFRSSKSRGP